MSEEFELVAPDKKAKISDQIQSTERTFSQGYQNVRYPLDSKEAYNEVVLNLASYVSNLAELRINKNFHNKLNFFQRMGLVSQGKQEVHRRQVEIKQEIDFTLQKYRCENKQEFSKLSDDSEDVALRFKIRDFCYALWRQSHDDLDDVVQFTVKMQEIQISDNIQVLENSFGQLLKNSAGQFTQQGRDGQLVHITNEHSSEDIGKHLIRLQEVVSRDDYTRNKTLPEWLRGVPKRDFGRKIWDGYAIFYGVCEVLSILISIADKYMQPRVKNLAEQYEKELQKTQNQLVELRRKTENYYRRFYPEKKPSNIGFVLGFIGFLALLFALLFGLLVLI